MDKDFNSKVFASFPDTLWTGEVPDVAPKTAKKTVFPAAARYFFYAAAAACMAFTLATLLLRSNKEQPSQVMESVSRSALVYKVHNATRADIVLEDSTRVTLNAGSTLTVAADFGQSTRTVTLDGEGLFDVSHSRSVPFIIETPQGIQVKVTGTRFNMSCYSDDPLFDLTLLEGSVEVTTPKKEVLHISPSEELIVKNGFLNVSRAEAPEEADDWTEGILRFDHTPMKEAISRLEKWYGVDIVVEDDGVYRNSISGVFRTEPISDVLHLICITSRLSYTLNDKTVTIRTR